MPPPAPQHPASEREVHAIIVAYHGAEEVAACLAELRGEVPVTVVDNSSSAEVADAARTHGAGYIDSGANRGFAAGVNVGLAELAGEDVDVLLLNPDAVVAPAVIRQLASFLARAENERVAAVAPHLRYPGGGEQRVVWPFPSPRRMWGEAIGLERVAALRRRPPPAGPGTFLIGAVLLLRREAIEDVGGFDERFFVYAEEADWQRRAQERGWTSVLCDAASAEHVSGTASSGPMRQEALMQDGQETFIRKWFGDRGWASYRLAALCDAAVRMIVLPGSRRRDAARRALLLLRGPRRYLALPPQSDASVD